MKFKALDIFYSAYKIADRNKRLEMRKDVNTLVNRLIDNLRQYHQKKILDELDRLDKEYK